MLFADLTERRVQECIKIGITADLGSSGAVVEGHAKKDDCDTVTNKRAGIRPPVSTPSQEEARCRCSQVYWRDVGRVIGCWDRSSTALTGRDRIPLWYDTREVLRKFRQGFSNPDPGCPVTLSVFQRPSVFPEKIFRSHTKQPSGSLQQKDSDSFRERSLFQISVQVT